MISNFGIDQYGATKAQQTDTILQNIYVIRRISLLIHDHTTKFIHKFPSAQPSYAIICSSNFVYILNLT